MQSSPCSPKEKRPANQLSASLKERLKRTRRSFTSPISVAKRLCVDGEKDGQQVLANTKEIVHSSARDGHDVDTSRNEVRPVTDGVLRPIHDPTQPPPVDALQLRGLLKREVRDRVETLRRLKLVKMYRNKNDLTELQRLIDKWRSCAQAALYELQTDLPIDGSKASLSQLIDMFGIDDKILHFDRTEDDFTS
ncbi:swi5-dependent recombination DNA repair protein 1 homolog [Lampris incognitus]|uniref:swi5-dependent recombination DNA repair protein 1 homolog n=1 Tax=Lampris incognitus TaxID=2546036 RepID=UPI0024B4B86D|nr:swi5-dependent recombination DNA repair protein 1 homolog [Lampris incognitus]